MSFNKKWDIEKYRDEHESDDHWELRRAFMEKWKDHYPEDRLLCLARVFTNIEFMGCRYPVEVMQEVARLSQEVAKDYRNIKKTKLQRTFVSASDAAEDRAKGIKRAGGIIIDQPSSKTRINFVPQTITTDNNNDRNQDIDNQNSNSQNKIEFHKGTDNDNELVEIKSDSETENTDKVDRYKETAEKNSENVAQHLADLSKLKCLSVNSFRESMFNTAFGRIVIIVRPWMGHLANIQASCLACNVPFEIKMENHECTVIMNGKIIAQMSGLSNQDAKSNAANKAWANIKNQVIVILMKEQWVAQDGAKVNHSDVSSKSRSAKCSDEMFGTPVDNTVATKMMKLMGWKGGGLGADSQGIAEPIKPHLQIVNRAGLGSTSSDIRQLRQAANNLMQRYVASDSLDVDLVFSSDFNKEERATLHQVARRYKLQSRSYGTEDYDRFLVVKKKVDPFILARALIQKGGVTKKYQIFIPDNLKNAR